MDSIALFEEKQQARKRSKMSHERTDGSAISSSCSIISPRSMDDYDKHGSSSSIGGSVPKNHTGGGRGGRGVRSVRGGSRSGSNSRGIGGISGGSIGSIGGSSCMVGGNGSNGSNGSSGSSGPSGPSCPSGHIGGSSDGGPGGTFILNRGRSPCSATSSTSIANNNSNSHYTTNINHTHTHTHTHSPLPHSRAGRIQNVDWNKIVQWYCCQCGQAHGNEYIDQLFRIDNDHQMPRNGNSSSSRSRSRSRSGSGSSRNDSYDSNSNYSAYSLRQNDVDVVVNENENRIGCCEDYNLNSSDNEMINQKLKKFNNAYLRSDCSRCQHVMCPYCTKARLSHFKFFINEVVADITNNWS
ncbi:hypothetical protein PACTADRAFT_76032 [Pachysolen tannophilus NRRL Y-2460]|uniref:Uncharacterized protein n=1 Tax=Pachysolen tannophilus NRRL Y-2460 TaxID=669874 RepID=A0A1E4TV86_PACTA|nr:hypothetical protein PACTADRAFT_76032 [Pachysolen tannophilus NRRL Y-2460]